MKVGDSSCFETGDGIELPVAGQRNASAGRPLVYGIRPEHVRLSPGGTPATVVITEPTGSETHVVARLGTHDLNLVFHQRLAARPGEEIGIAIDASAIHLFDKETGIRL